MRLDEKKRAVRGEIIEIIFYVLTKYHRAVDSLKGYCKYGK